MLKMASAIPVLRMFDEDVARAFYVDFLGFDVEWEHRHEEGLPLFMQIRRNACVLRLSGHHGDACPGALLSIEADNVALLADTLRDKGYKYARPGGTVLTPWGTREVTVTDPFVTGSISSRSRSRGR